LRCGSYRYIRAVGSRSRGWLVLLPVPALVLWQFVLALRLPTRLRYPLPRTRALGSTAFAWFWFPFFAWLRVRRCGLPAVPGYPCASLLVYLPFTALPGYGCRAPHGCAVRCVCTTLVPRTFTVCCYTRCLYHTFGLPRFDTPYPPVGLTLAVTGSDAPFCALRSRGSLDARCVLAGQFCRLGSTRTLPWFIPTCLAGLTPLYGLVATLRACVVPRHTLTTYFAVDTVRASTLPWTFSPTRTARSLRRLTRVYYGFLRLTFPRLCLARLRGSLGLFIGLHAVCLRRSTVCSRFTFADAAFTRTVLARFTTGAALRCCAFVVLRRAFCCLPPPRTPAFWVPPAPAFRAACALFYRTPVGWFSWFPFTALFIRWLRARTTPRLVTPTLLRRDTPPR